MVVSFLASWTPLCPKAGGCPQNRGNFNAAGYARETARAEELLARSHEPMRLRQAWTLGGEALLSLGRLDEADRAALKLLRLSEEVLDERGRGWALRLRGHVSSRLGRHEQARAFFLESRALCATGDDPSARLLVESRLAFDLLLTGEVDESLALAWPAAEEFARRKLRHPSAVNDGVFLAAAALELKRDGPSSQGAHGDRLRRAVWRTRIVRRELAHCLRLSAPLFFAGAGACDIAAGRPERGRRLIARALSLAQEHALRGDLYDVHALAAAVLTGSEGEEHARRAQELQEEFRSEVAGAAS
jgi:tetratricopeptide (TPR) repeat protein